MSSVSSLPASTDGNYETKFTRDTHDWKSSFDVVAFWISFFSKLPTIILCKNHQDLFLCMTFNWYPHYSVLNLHNHCTGVSRSPAVQPHNQMYVLCD